MQPLNTTVRPNGLSTIGWEPAADRSMIDSRRWPSATGPRAQTPAPSGPREASRLVIRSQAGKSAYRPSNRISPVKPHTSAVLSSVGRTGHRRRIPDDPGVLGPAAARGVDHQAASRRDPGQGQIGQRTVLRPRAAYVDERPQVDVPGLQ